MSDPLLINLARLVRDLLPHPEALVKIGRQNFERTDFETDYIVIDSLAGDAPLSSSEKYDGTAEQMTYSERVSRLCTFDFYGDQAHNNCRRFRLLARSQDSLELQESLGITLWHPSAATDVKALTGQQYGERMQLECQVHYNQVEVVDTLRIDTAQLRIIGERGLIYEQ
jgi:hypothetical protein